MIGAAALVVSIIFGVQQCSNSGSSTGAVSSTTVPPTSDTPNVTGAATPASTTAQVDEEAPLPFSAGTFRDSQPWSGSKDLDKNPWDSGVWPSDINYLSVGQDYIGGVQLALLADGVSATYRTCRSQTYSRTQVKWTEMKPGSELCIRVKDPKNPDKTRVGQLTIGSFTISSKGVTDVSFTGQIWEPTR
ncbi:hypothetical protein [Nocardia brasiliensis]|uniref:hypothetical protein n=1 Tax=Nocardia brasiliensis TaxID=37326 RepID=UPI002456ADCD|nr:hypothetical protein [Nocardia brasiliensis]